MEGPRIQQHIFVCVCVTFSFSEIVLKSKVQLLEIYRKTTLMNIIKFSLI